VAAPVRRPGYRKYSKVGIPDEYRFGGQPVDGLLQQTLFADRLPRTLSETDCRGGAVPMSFSNTNRAYFSADTPCTRALAAKAVNLVLRQFNG